ncbi:MAG: hypothetical protein RLZZ622_982, partial [Planctomycetota bacterium]
NHEELVVDRRGDAGTLLWGRQVGLAGGSQIGGG